MLYVSDLIGKPVVDSEGEQVGRLRDLLTSVRSQAARPPVIALVVRRADGSDLMIGSADVAVYAGPVITLGRPAAAIAAFDAGDALWVVRDVLDKEIIDTERARVVRANDVQVLRVAGRIQLANVNVGGLALLRRLGIAHLAERVLTRLGRAPVVNSVPWDSVELMPGTQHTRLRFSASKARALPPADLAEIISDLSPAEGNQVLTDLPVEHLADTLEEVEPDFQASLVRSLPDERVADVLEEMSPDEAADLLAELPEQRSASLLNLMDDEEAEDVRQLLTYEDDTAGGLMTTDLVSVRPGLTAGEAIAELRATAHEVETLYYIYVTDEQDHLLGVCSLQRLVLADPVTPITEIMHDRVIDVKPGDSDDDVAQLVAKYNLLAVPVVDDENHLLGIVTADDALDKILPDAWKKHLPRLFG